jgi:hypothetical protein
MEEDCGGGQGLNWAVEPRRRRRRRRRSSSSHGHHCVSELPYIQFHENLSEDNKNMHKS